MNSMDIRAALTGDAACACEVVRRSITELCGADHHDDPAHLGRWLANKTPENFAAWAGRPAHPLLVGIGDGEILAVGSVTGDGEITMLYVSPAARFRGVSRAMLAALEARAARLGNRRCRLNSSETAHRFYRARGYVDDGTPSGKFGMAAGYPMFRDIAAVNRP
jgi:GNAT superfamily N-acetyltransferase